MFWVFLKQVRVHLGSCTAENCIKYLVMLHLANRSPSKSERGFPVVLGLFFVSSDFYNKFHFYSQENDLLIMFLCACLWYKNQCLIVLVLSTQRRFVQMN